MVISPNIHFKTGCLGFQDDILEKTLLFWSNYSDVTRVLGAQKVTKEGRWDPWFQGNPGWRNIVILPDYYFSRDL